MLSSELNRDKRYIIGVIGDIPALLTFWQMFKEQSNVEALREIGVVAAALPGQSVLPELQDDADAIPTYASYRAMLDSHPEINMVIEATGRNALVHELRNYLSPSVTLVEKDAASFFIKLLTSDKMWVACKVDLLHTQNMLKTIIDQLDQEILFLDREGRVHDANKTVLDRMKASKKTLMGRNYCSIFSGVDSPECEYEKDPFARTLKTGEPAETVTNAVDSDGRMQYFRIYTYPIFDEDGAVNHVVAIRRDITQRTSMEHRLQQAEKLASIGELSTYMAHEIRNPLFTISGFANSLIRSESIDEKAREKLSIILDESKRLDTILKSLMNFTRPTEAQVAEVDLNELVTTTMNVMSLPCQNQDVTATIDLDETAAKVKANPDLIKQCLINLVKNSLEAMGSGGKLLVTTAMTTDYVVLTVEDTGHGIPLDIREKIFSPFFSTRGKGSGLGLAQTRKIVDEIGGNVELTSKEGVGTKVTLYLPPLLAVAEEDESE
ncbi:two-component system sensor histidine kinase NtrB [Pseudodesulfovibrio piezophilus]|uniref:two-component system sensor histidine kinase NtrB n=1 Tax=Pseudodesulfovibrio piezophilus TaxID=879567 RepID=UPI00034D47CC|nr:ATP-binding protein [Pseudodesulfovibrio piezophilus]